MKFRTALVGLGTGLVIALSACGNGPPPDQNTGGTGSSDSAGGGGDISAVTGQTAAQKIHQTDENKFSPDSLSVKVGDIVEWDNSSQAGHNVTFDQGLHSDTMSNGDTYQVKFAKAGSYKYQCTFHPGMTGTVTVTA